MSNSFIPRAAKSLLAMTAIGASLAWPSAAMAESCKRTTFKAARFIVCTYDPRVVDVRVVWRDNKGAAFGSLTAVRKAVRASGYEFVFAMNGGMYSYDLSPVGYHVEERQKLKNANTRRGPGNFHLLPNGIFFVENGRAGVMETRAFLKRNKRPDYATQSGPMLVINGRIHPRFNPKSQSRKSRNGVGTSRDGRTLTFAISEEPVTFYKFAELFRDKLDVPNALFLDGGSVPQMQSKTIARMSFAPVGPVVAIMKRGESVGRGQTRAKR